MLNVQVLNAVGIKLATDATVKKLVSALLSMPRSMFTTWLRFQFKAVFFPLCLLIGGLKFLYQRYGSKCDDEPLEPKCKDIVNAVKSLRNSVIMSISNLEPCSYTQRTAACNREEFSSNAECEDGKSVTKYKDSTSELPRSKCNEQISESPSVPSEENGVVEKVNKSPKVATLNMSEFTGSDIMWDFPILAEKAKYFAKCLREGDPEKLAAAKKALEEHPANMPMPKTRSEYNSLMEEAKNGPGHFVENTAPKFIEGIEMVNTGNKIGSEENGTEIANLLQKPKKKTVEFSVDDTEFARDKGRTNKCGPHLSLQNRILRHRLAVTNCKLEDLLRMCNHLLNEISNVSEQFKKFISIRDKVTALQSELDEGKKLLYEVEADRNLLRAKLMDLEKMIKEEEEYLDDVSCESGFEEIETNGDSPDEL